MTILDALTSAAAAASSRHSGGLALGYPKARSLPDWTDYTLIAVRTTTGRIVIIRADGGRFLGRGGKLRRVPFVAAGGFFWKPWPWQKPAGE